MIRTFKSSDLDEIRKIHSQFHERGFSMPKIAEAYANAVVEEDGKILGFGMLRDITESIMILDLSLPIRVKAKVLSQLVQESVMKSHHNHVHSFVELPTFEQVLKKHFGYQNCKGSALCLER